MSRPTSGRSVTPFLATSLLCTRVEGGSVAVHSGSIAETEFNFKANAEANNKQGRRQRPKSTPVPGSRGWTESSLNTPSSGPMLQQWINDKVIDKLQEKADPTAAKVKEMYSEVLENEETFVKDVSEYLEYSDTSRKRRKELLHKKWTDKVYVPLRRAVLDEINSRRYHDMMRTKQALYKQYLEHMNKKGHAFLESFDPNEYYPVALTANRPAPLKCVHQRLNDPTRYTFQSQNNEDRVIHACTYGTRYTDKDCADARLPLLRAAKYQDSSQWLQFPLTDINSSTRKLSQQRVLEDRNHSKHDMLSWNKANQGRCTRRPKTAVTKHARMDSARSRGSNSPDIEPELEELQRTSPVLAEGNVTAQPTIPGSAVACA